MNPELIDYIFNYYFRLLELKEKSAYLHQQAILKAENAESEKLKATILARWGSSDDEILRLLNNGYEQFRETVAERILRDHKDEIFINLCPKCHKLARTPLAKQCRFCSYSWH